MFRYRLLHIFASFLGAMALLGLFLLLSTQGAPLAAGRSSIVVNTLDDELNNDGDCSLREALKAAYENTPVDACPAGDETGDTISISAKGEILLADPLLIFPGDPLVIDGKGIASISGDRKVRIFMIYAGADLTLRNLSLVEGFHGTQGGGIYNFGSLTVENSTLSGNQAEDYGGAVYNEGLLRIRDSALSDNYVPNGLGGGIYNAAGAELEVLNTRFLRNNGSVGGGIYTNGKAEIRSSSISGSQAELGAGIHGGYLESAQLILFESAIYDNYAVDLGGDVSGQGGGIRIRAGSVTISNTTISANMADRSGGGIYASEYYTNVVMTITNSILFGNWNDANSGYVGASNLGCLYGADCTVRNSIIAGGIGGDNCVVSDPSTLYDGGYNIEDASTCSFTGPTSMSNTDPGLGPLQDNGGSTWTHALLPGSPAMDPQPTPIYCPAADQRGVVRPVDGDRDGYAICDLGPYEFRTSTTTTITSDRPDPSQVGEPFIVRFSVTTVDGTPTGSVTVLGGGSTCSGELLEGSGSCQMALTVPGTYTLTATYGGDSVFDFSRDTASHVVLLNHVYLPLINNH